MSSIFLCHSSKDKPFVLRLASDLKKHGVRVWIDQAEIQIGDSLIRKIREGIDKSEFFGAVISPNSIMSEWVQNELDIAMNQQIDGRRVKVLPIVYKYCKLPSFLPGKLYADFTDDSFYFSSLRKVVGRILAENAPSYEPDSGEFVEVTFDISSFLSTARCPKCGVYFVAAYAGYEFFEGVLSACPNCKTLYVYGKGSGPQPCFYEAAENPQDFLWTEERCEEFRSIVSDHYGYYGYRSAYCDHKDIVRALDYMNRALAVYPADTRHHRAVKEILKAKTLKPEWIAFEARFRRVNPSLRGDERALLYHLKQAERELADVNRASQPRIHARHKHRAINHLLFAMKEKLTYPGLYERTRELFLTLLREYQEVQKTAELTKGWSERGKARRLS